MAAGAIVKFAPVASNAAESKSTQKRFEILFRKWLGRMAREVTKIRERLSFILTSLGQAKAVP
jgi:hypothetical protein